MKYLLHGDDTTALMNRKRLLTEEFLSVYSGGQVIHIDIEEQGEEGFIEAIQAATPGLFGEINLVILQNTLATLGGKMRLESFPKEADIIFIETTKGEKKELRDFVKQDYTVEEYQVKKRDQEAILLSLEQELEGSLSREVKQVLLDRSPNSDQFLQNVRKVLTYSQGKKISPEDLDALVPKSFEVKVFDALDALVAGKKDRASILFAQLLEEQDIFQILSLCAWQVRQMILVEAAQEKCGPNKDCIAKEIKAHPFVVQKILRVLPLFPRKRLAAGLKVFSEIDTALKQGRISPKGAVNKIVFLW